MSKTVSKKTKRPAKAGKKFVGTPEISGKRLRLFKLISAPQGVSLDRLVDVLGWQKHTIRGAISTMTNPVKDGGLGIKINSRKSPRNGRVYQLAA